MLPSAHLQKEAWLQEAHGGGEAELNHRVRQLPSALLANAVAGQQPFSVRQHSCARHYAPVGGLLLQLMLLMLLHSGPKQGLVCQLA